MFYLIKLMKIFYARGVGIPTLKKSFINKRKRTF